jgi:hypothetical protein
MLTSLIEITPAAYRRGANQMRQQLSVGKHFWRGNAGGHRSRRRRPFLELSLKKIAGDMILLPRRHADYPDRDRLALRLEQFKRAG